MRNRRALSAGLALSVLSLLLLGDYLRKRERQILELGRPIPVWCAAEDIPSFQALKDRIALREIPLSYVRTGALVSSDYVGPLPEKTRRPSDEELARLLSGRTVYAGEQLSVSDLANESRLPLSERLHQGRAMTLSVDEITGLAGYLRPGDRVDVLGLFKVNTEGRSDTVARLLAWNKKVLACGANPGGSLQNAEGAAGDWAHRFLEPIQHTGRGKVTSVTLELDLGEIQRLALAQEGGLLSLVLRPPNATETFPCEDVRLSDLGLDIEAPARPRYREIRGQEIFGHQPIPSLQVLSERETKTNPSSPRR